jgi:hypothetical protein
MNKKDEDKIKKLAAIIESNPGCQIVIDNDCWWINDKDFDADSDEEPETLAHSDDFRVQTDFYSDGHCYGAAITEAFMYLLRARGLKFTAEAC